MADVSVDQLYSLQDEVLAIVFSTEREFYLTGGTCLHRFYQEKRYSDDLNFFTNHSPRFHFAVKNIVNALQQKFSIVFQIEAKDFVRCRVDNLLQVDFVNDGPERFGDPIFKDNGHIIDSIENILSNKLTAIIGRDNPKDIFDVFVIISNYPVVWKEILESAHRKAIFNNDELIIRLRTFPGELLKHLKVTDTTVLQKFEKEFPQIIEQILSIPD